MDDASRIREKTDIVSLLSEYIPLKKAGRNFKALCPFHGEKSPSFVISPERQIWHCFGCAKGGDCFSFLMEYEHLEFPEALRVLGKRAGIELSESQFSKGMYSKKEKIYKVNFHAMQYYHYLLTQHTVGVKALEYLKGRGVNDGAIKTFRIGFAPSVGSAAAQYLIQKKGYAKLDLLDAGLSYERGRDIIDFFKERIIFPLIDHRDNVVGFSGRSLITDISSKYINTKETLAYHKGSHFFGIHNAKDSIKKEDRAIIVEGEFDVISAFQEGIKNVVAVKGSSLTEDQVNLLARFTNTVSVCFDDDSAGFDAIRRSLPLLEKKGFETTVIEIMGAKDPDEALKKDPIHFKKSVSHPISVYDFLFTRIVTKEDVKNPFGKKRITEELLPILSGIENEIVKEHFLKKLSSELDVSLESIIREIEKIKKTPVLVASVEKTTQKRKRQDVLEEYVLALILQYPRPKELLEEVKKILFDFEFETSSIKSILDKLEAYRSSSDDFDSKNFALSLSKELLYTFDRCYLLPISKFETDEQYKKETIKISRELKILYVKLQIKHIGEKIKKEEKEETDPHLEELEKELTRLTNVLQG